MCFFYLCTEPWCDNYELCLVCCHPVELVNISHADHQILGIKGCAPRVATIKVRMPDACTNSFPRDTGNLGQAEGECRDGTCWPPGPLERMAVSPYVCLIRSLMFRPQLSRSANRSLSQKDWSFQFAASALCPG